MFKKLKYLVKDNFFFLFLLIGEVFLDSSLKMEVDVCNVEEIIRNGEEIVVEEI